MAGSDRQPSATGVAAVLAPLVHRLLGNDPPVAVRAWDGSVLGQPDAATTLVLRSPDAIRRLMYAPGELGLARAYVAGDLDLDGDVFDFLAVRDVLAGRDEHLSVGLGPGGVLEAWRVARRLALIGRPPPPPAEEARLRGRLHSKARDAAAIAHHYDVDNDFYRLLLGDSLTYSCAYWSPSASNLEEAQAAKHELVCTKLGLRPGMRLLDVGCGWGGMVLHAARHHGVEAVGVTVSRRQRALAEKRVAEAGMADRVQIRFQDYRDVGDGPYDAIASIGMFEHVGTEGVEAYFTGLHAQLRHGGRLLNHAISRPPGPAAVDPRSFIGRYVFPDGALHEVGSVVTAMQEHGFEVRDVESLREHYARTLRVWVANLEAGWDQAVKLVGAPRARVWRLYLAASAVNFEHGRTSIHQVLAVKPHPDGRSEMPLHRPPGPA